MEGGRRGEVRLGTGGQELALPGEEGGSAPIAGVGQFEQLVAAGEEGGIEIEVGGLTITEVAEGVGAFADGQREAAVFVADFVGSLVFG